VVRKMSNNIAEKSVASIKDLYHEDRNSRLFKNVILCVC